MDSTANMISMQTVANVAGCVEDAWLVANTFFCDKLKARLQFAQCLANKKKAAKDISAAGPLFHCLKCVGRAAQVSDGKTSPPGIFIPLDQEMLDTLQALGITMEDMRELFRMLINGNLCRRG